MEADSCPEPRWIPCGPNIDRTGRQKAVRPAQRQQTVPEGYESTRGPPNTGNDALSEIETLIFAFQLLKPIKNANFHTPNKAGPGSKPTGKPNIPGRPDQKEAEMAIDE